MRRSKSGRGKTHLTSRLCHRLGAGPLNVCKPNPEPCPCTYGDGGEWAASSLRSQTQG